MSEILSANWKIIVAENGNRLQGIAPGMEAIAEADRIRMISSYVIENTEDPPFAYSAITMLLNIFPDTIQDDTIFRAMLASEQDARKFHILHVNLGGHFYRNHDRTFIQECAPMLLRSDPVGKPVGEAGRNPIFGDISVGTYLSIVGYLNKLESKFEPPPDDYSHEERKMILARWLKENWPGCEDLAIPGDRAEKPRDALRPEAVTATQSAIADGGEDPGSSESPGSRWVWPLAVAGLVMALGFLISGKWQRRPR